MTKKCQYFYQIYPYAMKTCNAPLNFLSGKPNHTLDEGCKGYRTRCPAYAPERNIKAIKASGWEGE